LNGVIVVDRAKEATILQAVIRTYRPFGRGNKQACCCRQEKIAVSSALFKNGAFQRRDIGMGVEDVPGQIGKVLDIGVGDGPLMREQRHAYFKILKVIAKRMKRWFAHLRARLINSCDCRKRRGCTLYCTT